MVDRKTSKRNKENRPTEIINSALKLFEKKGFEETSFSDIAKDCDIARSTIYLYFSDKNDLIEKAIIAKVRENRDSFLEGKIEKGESKQEFIQNVLETLLLTFDRKKDDPFYILLTTISCRNKKIAEIFKKHVLLKMLETWHMICKDLDFSQEEENMYVLLIFSLLFTSQFMSFIYNDDSPFIQLSEFVKLSREQLKKEKNNNK